MHTTNYGECHFMLLSKLKYTCRLKFYLGISSDRSSSVRLKQPSAVLRQNNPEQSIPVR